MTIQLQKMKMLIAGEWKDSNTGARSSILDPSSGETIAEVPKASKQDAKAAVDSAREAFRSPEWRDMDSGKRGRILTKLAGLVRENSDELARLETLNEGKTLRSLRAMLPGLPEPSSILRGLLTRLRVRRFPSRLSG